MKSLVTLMCGGLVLLAPTAKGVADLRIAHGDVVVNGGSVVVLGKTQLSGEAATLTVDGALLSTSGLAGVEGSTLRLSDASGNTEALEITGGAGDLTFAGTVTDADGGPGGLFIGGGDSFILSGVNTYTGVTAVDNATLVVSNSSGSGTGTGSLIVMSGGTLGGSGRIGGSVLIESGGGVRPDMTLTFDAAVVLQGYVNLDLASAATESLLAAGELDIGSATLNLSTSNLTKSSYVLALYGSLTGGMFGSIVGLPAGYLMNYAFDDGSGSNHIALVLPPPPSSFETWAEGAGLTAGENDGFADDPNRDGVSNGAHFAFGTDPLVAGPVESPIRIDLIDDGGSTYLTLTLPLRVGTTFDGATSSEVDGIAYQFFGDDDLSGTDLAVVERSLAFESGDLPTIGDDWEYRSFRLATASDSGTRPQAFLWVTATDTDSSTVVRTATYGGIVSEVPAGSDTYVGVSLRAAAAYVGELETADAVAGGVELALTGVDGFTADVFSSAYYVRFENGAHAGEYFTVTGNGAGTVTIDSLGLDLSDLAPGDGLKVVKYRTLAELFPPASQATLVPSTGNFIFQRKSEVFFPDLAGVGVNRSPASRYYLASGVWRQDTTGFPGAGANIVLPDAFLILRHPATVADTVLSTVGVVETGPQASFIFAELAQANDSFLIQPQSVPMRLDELGLESVVNASTGNFIFQRADEVLLWDNTATGINKSPSRRLFRVGTAWRQDTGGFPSRNDLILEPGTALIVRKKADGVGAVTVWTSGATP